MRHADLRLRTGADDRGAGSATWPEDSLRVEHFSSKLGTLDPPEQPFTVELKDSRRYEVLRTRRCSPPCAPRTSTCKAIARKACADRAKCACWPARSTTATSCRRGERGEQPDDGLLLARDRRRKIWGCKPARGLDAPARGASTGNNAIQHGITDAAQANRIGQISPGTSTRRHRPTLRTCSSLASPGDEWITTGSDFSRASA
jgi:hypothetical protein